MTALVEILIRLKRGFLVPGARVGRDVPHCTRKVTSLQVEFLARILTGRAFCLHVTAGAVNTIQGQLLSLWIYYWYASVWRSLPFGHL